MEAVIKKECLSIKKQVIKLVDYLDALNNKFQNI